MTVAFLLPLAVEGGAEAGAGAAAAEGASAAGTTGGSGFLGRVMSSMQFGGGSKPAANGSGGAQSPQSPESEAQRV
jgi:hypothetical protein